MKLNIEVIKIPYSYLEEQFDGDVYNYFDSEGGNIEGMEYKGNTGLLTNMYIVLNFEDGKVYMVEFVTDGEGKEHDIQ